MPVCLYNEKTRSYLTPVNSESLPDPKFLYVDVV